MERFGLSDVEYSFMMDPLKRRHNQSKKQTIYGIFASDDSDSEPERSGFGGREAGFKRKGANYSAPITFVSGGVKHPKIWIILVELKNGERSPNNSTQHTKYAKSPQNERYNRISPSRLVKQT
ncbi:unnamed protein product [Schistosoma mattheei]|uniref:Uncharacterized protein n=1 Tax=Schistosoma mattheei TaxID=31246 RepID=A0A183P0C6_9TREM|nr:unnamed protein product [Schistosoma mattheei]